MEYAAQHDATKIGVINIKDLDGVKNAINVITADDTKIFQCISASAKVTFLKKFIFYHFNSFPCWTFQNEWIEKFEVALKFNQMKKKKAQAPQPPTRPVSTIEAKVSKSSTRTSLASEATISPTSTTSEIEAVNIKYAPEWLASAQEEIHTLIAQRHFEEALTLITKCEEYFTKDTSFYNATEIIQKVTSHGIRYLTSK